MATGLPFTFKKKLSQAFSRGYFHLYLFVSFISNFWKIKTVFQLKHGYSLNLKKPESFNEKIYWKKIFSRNPLLPIVSNKLEVRKFVADKLGEKADDYLIPLFYVTDTPESIPFDELPDEYIVKPNHRSGDYIIITDKESEDQRRIIEKAEEWLLSSFGTVHLEWCYQAIDRKILVQKLIRDSSGKIPVEYRFYCFDGFVEIFQADRPKEYGNTLFNRHGEKLDIIYKLHYSIVEDLPENLPAMIEIAEKLSAEFDFIRLDMFSVDGKILIGEMTSYPNAGLGAFEPTSFDFDLGSKWNLDKSSSSVLYKMAKFYL